MDDNIIDGRAISEEILDIVKRRVSELKIPPKLSVVFCGNDQGSDIYTKIKKREGEKIGFQVDIHRFDEKITQKELISDVKKLCNISDGVLVQLPLPNHIDKREVLKNISPEKDVDGLSPFNLGNLFLGDESFPPATPKAIITMLEKSNVELAGKNVVIINNSLLIGKPLAIMMSNRKATITICNSNTQDIIEHTKNADILISGVGKPGFIRKPMLKKGVVLIDAGICKFKGKVSGDADFEEVKDICSKITPVPGGVGPVTVATVLENTLNAYLRRKN
jgi:methylenetetrahydrofolate dehydrogenase (NADP+) / methenyltetrahydrofolate cyclohydrolase